MERLVKVAERLIRLGDRGDMTATVTPRAAAAEPIAPPSTGLSPPGGTPRWWADAGGVAAGVSVLIVVALWVSNRGLQEVLGGGPESVSALGRLTGLIASD